MKKSLSLRTLPLAALCLGAFVLTLNAGGMDAKPKSTNAEMSLLPPQKPAPASVFDLSQPYKDPFFPNSTRKRVKASAEPVVVNTCDPSQYHLKGISGVPGQEVVIINNRNAAAGESVDVTLLNGSIVNIKVLAIDQYSATILPAGQREPIVISLPKDAR